MLRILDMNGEEFDSITPKTLILTKKINELDTISFSISSKDKNSLGIKGEFLVETETDLYKIKAIDRQKKDTRFEAIQNVDELKNKALIKGLKIETLNTLDSVKKLLEGTKWSVKDMGCTAKKRSLEINNEFSIWDAILAVMSTWKHEFRIDTKNKTILLKEKFGEDKGVYFSNELNMHSFNLKTDTSRVYTRLYPYGKEGMSIADVNEGKEYVEDFTYTKEVIEKVWKDERYTVAANLLNDAKERLAESSRPWLSYSLNVNDLSSINTKEYEFLKYELGDTITVIDSDSKFKDKQRIVESVSNLNDPRENTVKLSTLVKKFGDLIAHIENKQETTESNVQNIQGNICNLQIGGYNYILDSDNKLQSATNDEQKLEFQFIDKAETMKYIQGQNITISCEVDGDIELESGGILFQYQLEGEEKYIDCKTEVVKSTNNKKRIWATFKLP